MPITDIQPRRHNSRIHAGVRVVSSDNKHGIVIATYVGTTWVLLDGERTFTAYAPVDLVREEI